MPVAGRVPLLGRVQNIEKKILRHPSSLAEGSGAIKAVTSERGILPPPGGRGPCARECGARKFLNAPADLQEPLKVADVVANASAEDSQLFNCLINSS